MCERFERAVDGQARSDAKVAVDFVDAQPLREVNASAIELLDEIDPWTLRPQERSDLADLTLALRRLRFALAGNDRS